MATVAHPAQARHLLDPEQRFLLRGVGWSGYEALLKMVGDGHVRLTCDGKDVELMSPSGEHEEYGNLIGRMIETVTEELNIPCEAAGSTTWKSTLQEKGLEPDECYYLANSERVIGKRSIDLRVDPPPDLALEVEISRSALDRLAIYAALGVPEVWRFDGDQLVIHLRQPDGSYALAPASLSLPMLTPDRLVHWIERAADMGQTPWIRAFRDWVRAELSPRHEHP